MRALVKSKAEPGLWVEDVPMPTITPDEVLLRVKRASICGTDLHIYQWNDWAKRTVKTPTTLGHEFMGVIEEVGSRVTKWKPGERVSVEGHVTCGQCRACRSSERYLCPFTVGTGVQRSGGFAEYVAVPAANLFRLPDSISDDIASLLDPLGNAVHSALCFPVVGKDVLITGAGPVGLMSAAVARRAGARHIMITDRNDERLETARKMGASAAINVDKGDLTQLLNAEGVTEGCSVGLEMSGSPNALRQLVENMRPGGHIVLLGILPRDTQVDWNTVVFRSLTLKGVYGREIFDTWYQSMALLESGLDITPIITHRLDFDQWEDGFKAMIAGTATKVVFSL